jgi:hypothetical protein
VSAKCEHQNFHADVQVGRLTDGDSGPLIAFSADIRIKCVDCNRPFQFVGVPMGSSPTQPMASVDLLELRAPIAPRGEWIPGGRVGFTVVPLTEEAT